MENILLIEPDYKCKYPPLGLMKISYYYKEYRNANVWFCKGRLPKKISDEVIEKIKNDKYYINKYGEKIDEHIEEINNIIKNNLWDRVNVCTLFTYEYKKTLEAIEYAKVLVGKEKVYTGGILATLMQEEFAKDTDVKVIPNQLISSNLLGYDDNINIDILTPDYSILSNTEYKYENNDAYYAYTTRGCGMDCGFCAVKILEPEFKPFISIKDQIKEIDEKYGPKKDLLLMDNNVLKSKYFETIIDEVIELGFERGATYINPKTGKKKRRFVDFNQGLDANFMTDKRAKLLSKIAIKPARIAFDHIEDEERYIKAITTAANNGINYLSNYILYNSEQFDGKGKNYKADTPEELYKRLEINVKLQEKLNSSRVDNEKIQIFSFPMRYIPLNNKERGYVGTEWNKKYLRAVQALLIATQGKGVGNKEFFYLSFGANEEEYKEILLMPEKYITSRGEPSKTNKKITEDQLQEKIRKYKLYGQLREEWKLLYGSMDIEEKKSFIDIISDNKFDYEHYKKIKSQKIKKIFLHYLTEPSLLTIIQELYNVNKKEEVEFIVKYTKIECNDIYKELCKYVYKASKSNGRVATYLRAYGKNTYSDLIEIWLKNKCDTKTFKDMINKFYIIDKNSLNIIEMIIKSSVLSDNNKNNFINNFISFSKEEDISYLLETATYVYNKMSEKDKENFGSVNLNIQETFF